VISSCNSGFRSLPVHLWCKWCNCICVWFLLPLRETHTNWNRRDWQQFRSCCWVH